MIERKSYTIFILKHKNKTYEMKIDTEDLKMFTKHKFYFQPSSNGYATYQMKYKRQYVHRIILNAPAHLQVDHINHDTLDNRKENLRLVSNKQNNENRKGCYSTSKSGIRGVCWAKREGKWRAAITHNSKSIHVGFFEKIEDAEKAVIEKRKKLGFLDANINNINSKPN